ncbi:hypothetical protein C8Q74DRAFT_1264184 [Fomes fomentarius]|nr:hypothetical protein C8Q74DRAFT_1264184 [Fomes fomentarius]
MEGMGRMEEEMDDLMKGKEALLSEKMALEERLVQETAKARQTVSELQRFKGEYQMLEAQFRTKQDTLNDLMKEMSALEDGLRDAKRTLADTQKNAEEVRLAHLEVVVENEVLKGRLAELQKQTCPLPQLQNTLDELRILTNAHEQEKQAHERLNVDHRVHSSCLDLSRAALRLADEERTQMRGTADSYRAYQRVSDDLGDTLVKTLEGRDTVIAQLKSALGELQRTAPLGSRSPEPLVSTVDVKGDTLVAASTLLKRAISGVVPRKRLYRDTKISSRHLDQSLSNRVSQPCDLAPSRASSSGAESHGVNVNTESPSRTPFAPLRLPRRTPSGLDTNKSSSYSRRSWF